SGEPGHGGVLVYLDLNNNGTFDTGEPSTVTQADDPNTAADETGLYTFYGLASGTYVIREAAPAGSVTTLPSASASTYSTNFDTIAGGTTLFTVQGATFSGGSVFAPSSSTLLASGTQAWNVSSGNAAVDFNRPIGSVTFFYVHGSGFAAGTATAYA